MSGEQQPCALCRQTTQLKKSHYLPAALYNIARTALGENAQPVLYDGHEETVLFSNKQATTRLLCIDCEKLFNSRGESYTLQNCFRSPGRFALRTALEHRTPSRTIDFRRRVWFASDLAEEPNAEALRYFVLSILWRGSVGRWPHPFNGFHGALGRQYDERIAGWLLQPSEPPPEHVFIEVYVDQTEVPIAGVSVPRTRTTTEPFRVYLHSFEIPGLRFLAFVGKAADQYRDLWECSESLIFIDWHSTKTDFYRELARQVRGARAIGKLAQR